MANRHERRHGTASTPKKRNWTTWLVLAVLVLAVAGVWYYNANKSTGVDYTRFAYTDEEFAVENPTHIVEEYSDFECPFCQQFAPTMEAVRDQYKGTVQVVYKQFPLRTIHPQAQLAAEAAECAREQNKFWAYHDVLFSSKQLDKRALKKHAEGLGLDMSTWNSCMDEGRAKPKIQQDITEGTQKGVRGTPTVFVDGQQFNGRNAQEFSTVLK